MRHRLVWTFHQAPVVQARGIQRGLTIWSCTQIHCGVTFVVSSKRPWERKVMWTRPKTRVTCVTAAPDSVDLCLFVFIRVLLNITGLKGCEQKAVFFLQVFIILRRVKKRFRCVFIKDFLDCNTSICNRHAEFFVEFNTAIVFQEKQ